MAVLGGYIGGGPAYTVGDIGARASSVIGSVAKTASALAGRAGTKRSAPVATGGGFDPQKILQAEEQLRQSGLKTCLGLIKDSSGNVVGVSPRHVKLEENCPEGTIDATTFASSGGITGTATGSTPPAPPTPPAETKTAIASVPWYKKWWVWALILGGTATVGIGGYMIYRRRRASTTAGLGQQDLIPFSVITPEGREIPFGWYKSEADARRALAKTMPADWRSLAILIPRPAIRVPRRSRSSRVW